MATKKPTKKSSPDTKALKSKMIRGESFRSIYSNSVQFLITKWDIRLTFAELVPEGGKAIIEEKASIVMSHAHFTSMLKVMNDLWEDHKDKLDKL